MIMKSREGKRKKELFFVAPMNTPKWSPCVFVADGMIYAIGCPLYRGKEDPPPDPGHFERYKSISDEWEILRDPPLPLSNWAGGKWFGSATVNGCDLDDPDVLFAKDCFKPWRDIFHMGGRLFCYVVTAQLIDWDFHNQVDYYSRGVWIKFLEEVQVTGHTNTHFRTLASFCYRINTEFRNFAVLVQCSILGTVPDSWIEAAPKIKQQENEHVCRKSEVVTTGRDGYYAQNSSENAVSRESGSGDVELRTRLTVLEE